jgi:hypothetical protein
MVRCRRVRGMGYIAHMEEKKNACGVLVGKLEGKGQSGRTQHRWEDNIKIYLNGIEREDVDWIYLPIQRRVVGCCEHGDEHLVSIRCWKFLDYLNDCSCSIQFLYINA